MNAQQLNSTPVEISGTVYYFQGAQQSWSDVEPVPGETQGMMVNQDEFSGTEQWDGQHQQWYQPMHNQWNEPNDQFMVHSGTTYFLPLHQELHQESSNESSAPSTGFEETNNRWISSQPTGDSLQNVKNSPSFEVRQLLESWTLPRDEQVNAGYPAFNQYGEIVIEPTIYERGTNIWIDDRETTRRCSRCAKYFEVLADGNFPIGKEICQFEVRRQKKSADSHVTNQRFISELHKFVETPAPFGENDSRSIQVYAIDAEMVLTTAGPALARVSMVGFDGHLEMDIIIKPEARVIDPLTEFSGMTMEMLETATHTVESCQEAMFELINSQTILIGHGLASDLKAMRLVHHNIIDTAIMFQDDGKNKVSLRVLAKSLLNRRIQQDNPSTFGHNPEEDALASLDLVKFRINRIVL